MSKNNSVETTLLICDVVLEAMSDAKKKHPEISEIYKQICLKTIDWAASYIRGLEKDDDSTSTDNDKDVDEYVSDPESMANELELIECIIGDIGTALEICDAFGLSSEMFFFKQFGCLYQTVYDLYKNSSCKDSNAVFIRAVNGNEYLKKFFPDYILNTMLKKANDVCRINKYIKAVMEKHKKANGKNK